MDICCVVCGRPAFTVYKGYAICLEDLKQWRKVEGDGVLPSLYELYDKED